MSRNSRRPLGIMAIIFAGILSVGGLLLWLFQDSGIVNR